MVNHRLMHDLSYQWTCVTGQAEFAARDGAGALVYRDRMWLLGGWNPGDSENFPEICNSEVWNSTDGITWTEVCPKAPWEGRHTAGYVVHDERMWIVGGDSNQGHYQPDVWSSSDGVTWDCVAEEVPWGQRALHHTVAFDGRIWVMGGQTLPQMVPSPEIFYNDVWNSIDGCTWNRVTDSAPWPARGMIGHSAVFHGRIWLIGGGTYDTPSIRRRKFYNDVWSTVDGIKWERHTDEAPWKPRQYHDVAVWDDKLWVMEGWYDPVAIDSIDDIADDGNMNDVWFSADGTKWTELSLTPWAPRHAASPFVFDDALWVVTGNNMESDVWKLQRH